MVTICTQVFFYQLNYSMQQSPSWGANRLSASQDFPRILWNPKVSTAFTSARHLSLSWATSIQSMPSHPTSVQVQGKCSCFATKPFFYGEELSEPRPTPKLEDHPLSAVAATLHIGGRSSIRNLTTRHAVVTGTQPLITDSPRFNIQQFYVLPKQCIYLFCVALRTKSDYFSIQH
jgi:hypothetical protein